MLTTSWVQSNYHCLVYSTYYYDFYELPLLGTVMT